MTMKLPTQDPLLTDQEAADYLGTKKATLAVWRSTGRYNLPYLKIGRLVRYKKSDLDAFITRRTYGAGHAEAA
jgi:excisionase family DNA binding protein